MLRRALPYVKPTGDIAGEMMIAWCCVVGGAVGGKLVLTGLQNLSKGKNREVLPDDPDID